MGIHISDGLGDAVIFRSLRLRFREQQQAQQPMQQLGTGSLTHALAGSTAAQQGLEQPQYFGMGGRGKHMLSAPGTQDTAVKRSGIQPIEQQPDKFRAI